MKQSQLAAAAAVRRVLEGRTLTAALADANASAAGPARSLVQELVYGTLRHFGTLEALTRALADKPIPDRRLAALVAVALYQLDHTRSPPFAVVDQAVGAAGVLSRAAAKGLVNAMLRRYLREREALQAAVRRDPVARWSHPRWWISRVQADWPGDWQDVLAAGNERPPLALRVNARRTTRDAFVARLEAAGIASRSAGDAGVIVDPPRPVRELPGFDTGEFSVQDLGAQIAATLCEVGDGMRVLDACAAPGGKSTHLLELADVRLTSLDDDAERMRRIEENVARLGLDRMSVTTRVGDASAPEGWWDGVPFDRVLADVPCSASGVVRRHPDGKWLRRADDVAAFARRQRAILDACWRVLSRGGALVYATCSVFREENDARIDEFVATHPDALRETLTFDAGVRHSGGQLLPSLPGAVHNQDGFFYARLRKA